MKSCLIVLLLVHGICIVEARRPPNNCHTNPELYCLNGGSCRNPRKTRSPQYYHCLCPPQYCGKRCQAANPCYYSNLCFHKGYCACRGEDKVSYVCYCYKPFTGKNCETLPDQFNPCYYPNNCPENTICEPDIYVPKTTGRRQRALVYNCRYANGLYALKNEMPQPYLPVEPKRKCSTKRKCDTNEKCVNNTCTMALKPKSDFVTVVPASEKMWEVKLKNISICEDNSFSQHLFKTDNIHVASGTGDSLFPDIDEEDKFSDIDTSETDTSGIDSAIFYEKRKWHKSLSKRDELSGSKDHQYRKMEGDNRDQRDTKTVTSNPCRHSARCILQVGLHRNTNRGYKCLCPKGTKGRNCSVGCPEGTFNPPECKQRCGQCSAYTCDYMSGVCRGKCLPGWRGRFCKVRDSYTLFMQMKLSGSFNKALRVHSSSQYQKIKNTVTNWITPLCVNDIKLACSLFNIKVTEGSVNVAYEVLFNLNAAANAEINVSLALVQFMNENVDRFNSTEHKLVPNSLQVTSVQEHAFLTTDARNNKLWYILGASVSTGWIIFLGLILFIVCRKRVKRRLHKQTLNYCKTYY